jgi:hypothetical protein
MTNLPLFLVAKARGLTAEQIIERLGTENDAVRFAQYKAANSPAAPLRRWVETTPAIWVPIGFLLAAALAGVWEKHRHPEAASQRRSLNYDVLPKRPAFSFGCFLSDPHTDHAPRHPSPAVS